MSRFIETIRADHGIISPLQYHQQRVNETLSHFGGMHSINLEHALKTVSMPNHPITKIRIVYGAEGIDQIECIPYELRHINSLAIVHADDLAYSYKFLDRNWLTELIKLVDADEIIIVKNRMITDASYANLAFCKKDTWYTPHQPLLKGTKRAALLDQGILTEDQIGLQDLHQYSHVKLINAMMHWEESPVIEINQVVF